MNNPFARPKPNPKRARPRRTGDRVRLRGEKMTELRRQAFERSGGRCEAKILYSPAKDKPFMFVRCWKPITWDSMELMHTEHGPRKSDTLDTVLAGCKECHRNEHNAGGKPVPRKAGRKMNKKEAPTYWEGTVCFCKQPKPARWSLCPSCYNKLSPQLQYDLENAVGGDWLTAMALAEQALLKESV